MNDLFPFFVRRLRRLRRLQKKHFYAWSFTSRPAGSEATVVEPGSARTHFVIDAPGLYALQLLVRDAAGRSDVGTVGSARDARRPRLGRRGP